MIFRNSFAESTEIVTPQDVQDIAALNVGDTVTAYNPRTGKPEAKTVQHVFINHDNNLLDVTIAPIQAKPAAITDTTKHSTADVKAGSQAPPETLHTTTEHPFLTTDRGFVNAEDLRIGEQVRQLDGSVGMVTSLQHIFGIAVRYNLTVADDHTYAVGSDQWVVHNQNCSGVVTFSLSASQYGQYQSVVNTFIARSNGVAQQAWASGHPFQRVPVPKGSPLQRQADAVKEQWRNANMWSRPGSDWDAGHIPDTTWTGTPYPPGGFMWLPQGVNRSIGRQALNYPVGYIVTGFQVVWAP